MSQDHVEVARAFWKIWLNGEGAPSGEMKIANVFRHRNGKVTKLVMYGDRHRALADLGLAPEDE